MQKQKNNRKGIINWTSIFIVMVIAVFFFTAQGVFIYLFVSKTEIYRYLTGRCVRVINEDTIEVMPNCKNNACRFFDKKHVATTNRNTVYVKMTNIKVLNPTAGRMILSRIAGKNVSLYVKDVNADGILLAHINTGKRNVAFDMLKNKYAVIIANPDVHSPLWDFNPDADKIKKRRTRSNRII